MKINIINEKKEMLKICVSNEGTIKKGLAVAELIYEMLGLQANQVLLNTFQKFTAKGKQRKVHKNFLQILDARLEQFVSNNIN